MTKEEALKVLANMRSGATNSDMREALDCALEEVGRCPRCAGRKEVQLPERPSGPCRSQIDTNGTVRFFVGCQLCKGTGKCLDLTCVSCGKNSKIKTDHKHINHCASCSDRLVRKGVL